MPRQGFNLGVKTTTPALALLSCLNHPVPQKLVKALQEHAINDRLAELMSQQHADGIS
jgi:hypothetical protein